MSEKQKFILTFDKDMSDRLQNDNFTLISYDNGRFVFLNDSVLKFDKDKEIDNVYDKITYTNMYFA